MKPGDVPGESLQESTEVWKGGGGGGGKLPGEIALGNRILRALESCLVYGGEDGR